MLFRTKFWNLALPTALVAGVLTLSCSPDSKEEAKGPKTSEQSLPEPGAVVIDDVRQEVILSAKVQFPEGKPCINEYGQRIQAFAGCATAAGGDAKMAGYFVFLVDVPTETVHDALIKLGCRNKVNYSITEGRKRSGLKAETTTADYLQGDPVMLSVFWKGEDGEWVERPYRDFVTEQVTVGETTIEKPWTPSFVFHGSGAVHSSGTGCIACPCDCPGGIIADNRNPIYDPKPMVKFDMSKAPPLGPRSTSRSRSLRVMRLKPDDENPSSGGGACHRAGSPRRP